LPPSNSNPEARTPMPSQDKHPLTPKQSRFFGLYVRFYKNK
jgi:hypothetical protein